MPTTAEKQSLEDRLTSWCERFDRCLSELLESSSQVSARLAEAMRYSLLLPGKRIRPFLVTEVGSLCGAAEQDTLPAALAIECVHGFSLIHDDLPAMDDDELRRGQPCNHKVFGEGLAVLAGDGLLALAFEVLAKRAESPQIAAGWVAELAEAAGWQGMIGGQAADLLGENQPPDAELVARIHRSKTARLIQCACRLGAIAASAEPEDYRAVSDYGLHVGLAFQMADDLLDVTGRTETVGKNVSKDADKGKQTYVRVVGMERAQEMVRSELRQGLDSLAGFDSKADTLRLLARFVVERNR
jgi:geranylgeranyl pyrophosphate synthase